MRRNLFVAAALAAVLIGAVTLPKLSVQAKTNGGGKVSGLITLFGTCNPDQINPLQLVQSNGTLGELTLPAGSVLVVTDLLITTKDAPSAGLTRGGLTASGVTTNSPYFSFDATKQPHEEIHLVSGAVWALVPELSNAPDSANSIYAEVHGYLAKDK
jgi:hypothetical protein